MDGIGLWRHPLHFINHMSYQHLVNCFVNKALAGRIKKGVGVENVNSWCDVKDSVFCGEPDGPPSQSASPPSLPSVYATPPRPYKAWLSHTSCLDHSSLVELPPVTTRSRRLPSLYGWRERTWRVKWAKIQGDLEMKWSKQCRYFDWKTQRAVLIS